MVTGVCLEVSVIVETAVFSFQASPYASAKFFLIHGQ